MHAPSKSYLSMLDLDTPAPSLEAALQFCPSESSTPVSPRVALSRKTSSLLGKVAGTAGNHSVGAVALSSRAGERGTHPVGAIADDAQIKLVRKGSGSLQANGSWHYIHVYGM